MLVERSLSQQGLPPGFLATPSLASSNKKSVLRRFVAALPGLLRSTVVVSAYAYPVVLAVVVLALRYVGEGYWMTALALFLPRVGFALPLPFLVVGLLVIRRRELLVTQLVAGLLVLFPLMGLVLPGSSGEKPGESKLRVLSFNVDSGWAGYDTLCERIFEQSPDIVAIQEAGGDQGKLVKVLSTRYPHVLASTQFVLASRYPIRETTDPEKLPYYDRKRSPRFLRHSIETPLGMLTLFNVHPISPRGVLQVHRGRAALVLLKRGELFEGEPSRDVAYNAGLRSLQIASVGQMAREERDPVVVVGDLNLPSLSPTLARSFAPFSDGFSASGSGFGYTFPAKFPFLRLDRILTNDRLRVTRFDVGCKGLSDHFCVVADLQKK
ncbi:MAG TPA: endonuclease/exonuclease/phosphatase family protein [Polyangiaceae bacterium]